MPIKAADKDTRRVIFDILSGFLFQGWQDQSLSEFISQIYETYHQISHVDGAQLNAALSKNKDIRLWNQKRYLLLEPAENKKIFPLLTLRSSGELTHFRLYALLVMLDKQSKLQSLAIRFETDEGDPDHDHGVGSHDFCHAQLCNYIDDEIWATTPEWIPVSQPSIPLDADNQVGLVLCMLTSLYGGAHVVDKLTEPGDITIIEHLQRIRALQHV